MTFEKIKPKMRFRLDENQITISTRGHQIYLGEAVRKHVLAQNIKYVDYYFDKVTKRILLKPSIVGGFKTMISYSLWKPKTPQIVFSIPHSQLEMFSAFDGKHLAKITENGIEIELTE